MKQTVHRHNVVMPEAEIAARLASLDLRRTGNRRTSPYVPETPKPTRRQLAAAADFLRPRKGKTNA